MKATTASPLEPPARFLATVLVAGVPVVEILDANGTVIAKRSAAGVQARWSPDRSALAWVGDDGLMVERADGGGRRLVLATPRTWSLTFAWSPDGQRLLVGGFITRVLNRLVVVSVRTGRRVVVAVGPDRLSYTALDWLPDGRIAYLRQDNGPAASYCCRLDLLVATADGSRARRLWSAADGGLHDTPGVIWSPNGRLLSLGTRAFDPHDPPFAIVNVSTGQLHRLDSYRNGCGGAWSADSRAFAVGGRSVAVLTPNGRVARVLGGRGCPVGWSRDGTLFLVDWHLHRERVLASVRGRSRPRPLFTLPRNQSISSFDPA